MCIFCFLCSSGTDEEHTERDWLLDSLVELYKEEKEVKAKAASDKDIAKDRAQKDRELGEAIMRDATATLKDKDTAGKLSNGMNGIRLYMQKWYRLYVIWTRTKLVI